MTPENLSWLMIGAQLMMLIWMTAKALNFSRMGIDDADMDDG